MKSFGYTIQWYAIGCTFSIQINVTIYSEVTGYFGPGTPGVTKRSKRIQTSRILVSSNGLHKRSTLDWISNGTRSLLIVPLHWENKAVILDCSTSCINIWPVRFLVTDIYQRVFHNLLGMMNIMLIIIVSPVTKINKLYNWYYDMMSNNKQYRYYLYFRLNLLQVYHCTRY